MLKWINHVALIVSGEATIDFYRKLGFQESSRKFREDKNDYLIMMSGENAVLEVFLRTDAPARHCNPEAYGCRHIAFDVECLEDVIDILKDYPQQSIRVNDSGQRFIFITDPDGQPVEFLEVK